MKLICLNIWGGKVYKPFIDFVNDWKNKVDILCLQEVFDGAEVDSSRIMHDAVLDIYTQLKVALPNYNSLFDECQDKEEGLAIFFRRDIQIKDFGETFVYRSKNAMINHDARTMGRNMQYLEIVNRGEKYTIMNFHGLWNGQGKTDTPERTLQSENIKKFLDQISEPKILCGDFNLEPNTKSLAILELGMRNLVKEYNITSTRSSYYTKLIRFADYILVSPDIKVKEFRVLPDEVSDHLPLYLEFE
ncbi:MAG TPA: endonuclease/exonuclease/phosphatase family protein [Patescibacteria group bacterium]|nr:endonuclease/exonuclease/phosphatase family protein [Patescibacteria group bacterium]